MKRKYLFKKPILLLTLMCSLVMAFVSCSNEETETNTNNNDETTLATFVTGPKATMSSSNNSPTRTSMDYTSGDFYWEPGDYIYVKDDNNAWQKSTNAPESKEASFRFKVPGKFTDHTSYEVYYPGKEGNKDKVTIPTTQTQTAPNDTKHIGVAGDCGTATANKVGNAQVFSFKLDHQAAILVFQPFTTNAVLQSCMLTKVEVSADNDIAATYTLTSSGLTGSGSGQMIELTTKGSDTYADGFPMTTSTANIATNGAYMVIKPGTHILKVRYWLKDKESGIEGTITKVLTSFNYEKNKFYDVKSNLNVRSYSGDRYFMWDAKKQYWTGWEWKNNLPDGQPTTSTQANSPNYAKSASDNRWYNVITGNYAVNKASVTCKDMPNVNEMVWYAEKGNPHSDTQELWTVMGHLYKGGMWIKKKANISGFNANKTPDNKDLRKIKESTDRVYSSILSTPLSAAEASQYFYLPAMGNYLEGRLNGIGYVGSYWSSSIYPDTGEHKFFSYMFWFTPSRIKIVGTSRGYGFWTRPFE